MVQFFVSQCTLVVNATAGGIKLAVLVYFACSMSACNPVRLSL